MKVQLESTEHIVNLQGLFGVQARIWTGTDEKGNAVTAFISRIGIDAERDELPLNELIEAPTLFEQKPNVFYTRKIIEGISTLLEVHYRKTDSRIEIIEWFDPAGDEPDLNLDTLRSEIENYEHATPLDQAIQVNLSMEFKFGGVN